VPAAWVRRTLIPVAPWPGSEAAPPAGSGPCRMRPDLRSTRPAHHRRRKRSRTRRRLAAQRPGDPKAGCIANLASRREIAVLEVCQAGRGGTHRRVFAGSAWGRTQQFGSRSARLRAYCRPAADRFRHSRRIGIRQWYCPARIRACAQAPAYRKAHAIDLSPIAYSPAMQSGLLRQSPASLSATRCTDARHRVRSGPLSDASSRRTPGDMQNLRWSI